MKSFLKYCLLFILPFIIGAVILFDRPYDKKFAYHYIEDNCFNHGSWVYERIFESDKNVDLAFIGSSHSLNAIQDSLMDVLINKDRPDSLHCVNFGFCWLGFNAEYLILKDLLENKSPNAVVLELREWTENTDHIIFPYIAATSDIIEQPFYSKLSCVSNCFTALLSRWEYLRFGFDKLDTSSRSTDLYGFEPRGETATKEELEKQIVFQNKRFGADGTHLNNTVRKFDEFYLNKIIELCKAHNADLYFLYLPSYGEILGGPVDRKLFPTDKLLIPPKTILNDATNWSNTSHLNEKGAKELTEWLSTENIFTGK